jgi:hypothetical protein
MCTRCGRGEEEAEAKRIAVDMGAREATKELDRHDGILPSRTRDIVHQRYSNQPANCSGSETGTVAPAELAVGCEMGLKVSQLALPSLSARTYSGVPRKGSQ